MLRKSYERALGRPVSIWESIKISFEFAPFIRFWFFALSLFFASIVSAQDCRIPINFAVSSGTITPAVGAPFNNKAIACVNWQMNVFVSGISALSIQLESANDLGGNTPGAFAAFAGTVLSGSNPSTTTTESTTTFTGMFPWLRVNPTSATGTGNVVGVVYGFKATSSSINSIFGGTALQLFGVALTNLTNPNNLTWTALNLSTATFTNKGTWIDVVKTPDAATQFTGWSTPVTAGSFTCVIGFTPIIGFASFAQFGIFITDGTKAETFRLREDGATQDVVTWTNASTVSATPFSSSVVGRSPNIPRIMFMKVKEGTQRTWQWSGDGVNWSSAFSEANGTFLTPTGCGIFVLNNQATAGCNPDTSAAPCYVADASFLHATVSSP